MMNNKLLKVVIFSLLISTGIVGLVIAIIATLMWLMSINIWLAAGAWFFLIFTLIAVGLWLGLKEEK